MLPQAPLAVGAEYLAAVLVAAVAAWELSLAFKRRVRLVVRVVVLAAVAVWVGGALSTGWASFVRLGGTQSCAFGAARCVEFLLANGERIDISDPLLPLAEVVAGDPR